MNQSYIPKSPTLQVPFSPTNVFSTLNFKKQADNQSMRAARIHEKNMEMCLKWIDFLYDAELVPETYLPAEKMKQICEICKCGVNKVWKTGLEHFSIQNPTQSSLCNSKVHAVFWGECIAEWIQSVINGGDVYNIKCPDLNCESILQDEEIRLLTDSKLYKK